MFSTVRGGFRSLAAIAILLGILAAYPFLFPSAMNFGFYLVLFAAMATSWDIIGGWAGQLSLGHAAFVGIGAYCSALLANLLGVPPWLGFAAAVLLGTVVSVVWGLITFRLRGAYFALSTIAVAEILRIVTNNWSSLTGGPEGVSINSLPTVFGFDLFDRTVEFYLALVLLALTLMVAWWVRHSRFGYYLKAIREDEDSAMALGVNPLRMKLAAFAISAALTTLGGCLYAVYLSFFEPTGVFDLHLSVQLVLMSIVGGMGSIFGPALGAGLLLSLQEVFRDVFQQASLLIYGIIIVIIVRFAPNGLSGAFQAAWRRWGRVRRAER